MSFWENHRKALYVLGGFLLVWFALWLFALRGYAYETEQARSVFEGDIKKRIEALCPPEKGETVANLRKRFLAANAAQEEAYATYRSALNFRFTDPLVPPAHVNRPQQYVRDEYKRLLEYFRFEADTKRNVRIEPGAQLLGFSFPEMTTESIERDRVWLRQMEVVRRFVDLLLSVVDEPDKTKNLVAIDSIKPFPAQLTGPEPAFIEEYPVEAEIRITLTGLMRLLAKCSSPGTYHMVQSIQVESVPEARRSADREVIGKETGRRWTVHYYRVNMRVATLVIQGEEPDKASETKPKPEPKPAQPTLLPH